MPVLLTADSMSIELWVLIAVPLLVGILMLAGTIGGVVLGSYLNRKASREEREATEWNEPLAYASEFLGDVRVLHTNLDPSIYAAYASDKDVATFLDVQAGEALRIRPHLAALGIR